MPGALSAAFLCSPLPGFTGSAGAGGGGVARHVAVMRHYGYTVPADLLTGTELRELEPTLSRRAETGYLIGQERHIDPARLTAGLAGLAGLAPRSGSRPR